MNRMWTVFLLGVLCCVGVAGAEDQAQEELSISGDFSKTIFAKGREYTSWDGNVVMISNDNEIHADHIDAFGDNFESVTCTGNLLLINEQKKLYLTCEKLTYDRNKKFLTALGNVYMEDRKNEIVARGNSLQHNEETDETIIQVRVRIFQEEDDLHCRAEFARYLRAEDTLILSGMPHVLKGDDEYRAAKIVIDLEEDTVVMEGEVEGKIGGANEGE